MWNRVTDKLPGWDELTDRPMVIVRLVRVDEYGMPIQPEDPLYVTAKLQLSWISDAVYFSFIEGGGNEYESWLDEVPENSRDLYPSLPIGKYKYYSRGKIDYMIHSWILIEEFEKLVTFEPIEAVIRKELEDDKI